MKIKLLILSMFLNSCSYIPAVKTKAKTTFLSQNVQATIVDGKTSLDINNKVDTVVSLSNAEGSSFENVSIGVPAGTLSINTTLIVEEPSSLSENNVTGELGLSASDMQSTGSSLLIRPSNPEALLTGQLQISMPIPKSTSLFNFFQSTNDRVIVFFKTYDNETKQLITGFKRGDDLIFNDDGSVYFLGGFGAYWITLLNVEAVKKVETVAKTVPSTEPILNKQNISVITDKGVVEESKIVTVSQTENPIYSFNVDYSLETLKFKVVVKLDNQSDKFVMTECKLKGYDIFTPDEHKVFEMLIAGNSASTADELPSNRERDYTINFLIVCQDSLNRFTRIDTNQKIFLAKNKKEEELIPDPKPTSSPEPTPEPTPSPSPSPIPCNSSVYYYDNDLDGYIDYDYNINDFGPRFFCDNEVPDGYRLDSVFTFRTEMNTPQFDDCPNDFGNSLYAYADFDNDGLFNSAYALVCPSSLNASSGPLFVSINDMSSPTETDDCPFDLGIMKEYYKDYDRDGYRDFDMYGPLVVGLCSSQLESFSASIGILAKSSADVNSFVSLPIDESSDYCFTNDSSVISIAQTELNPLWFVVDEDRDGLTSEIYTCYYQLAINQNFVLNNNAWVLSSNNDKRLKIKNDYGDVYLTDDNDQSFNFVFDSIYVTENSISFDIDEDGYYDYSNVFIIANPYQYLDFVSKCNDTIQYSCSARVIIARNLNFDKIINDLSSNSDLIGYFNSSTGLNLNSTLINSCDYNLTASLLDDKPCLSWSNTLGTYTHPFYGVIDGQNNLISDLKISKLSGSGNFGGLVSEGGSSLVKNLLMRSVVERSSSTVDDVGATGGIVGSGTTYLSNVTMIGAVVVNAVEENDLINTGGVFGKFVYNSQAMVGIRNFAKVKSNTYNVGGIFGEVGNLICYHCFNMGTVDNNLLTDTFAESTYHGVGGLVGYASGFVTLNNSFSHANVSGMLSCGGMIGKTSGSVTLNKTYSSSIVKCKTFNDYTLVGEFYSDGIFELATSMEVSSSKEGIGQIIGFMLSGSDTLNTTNPLSNIIFDNHSFLANSEGLLIRDSESWITLEGSNAGIATSHFNNSPVNITNGFSVSGIVNCSNSDIFDQNCFYSEMKDSFSIFLNETNFNNSGWSMNFNNSDNNFDSNFEWQLAKCRTFTENTVSYFGNGFPISSHFNFDRLDLKLPLPGCENIMMP